VTTNLRTAGRAAPRLGAAVLLAFAAGCGSGERVYDVSGAVNWNGQPVPAGIIFFDPDPMKGGSGPQGVANIVDGKYTTAVKGQGIRGGAYVIRITGYDGKTANEAPLGQPLFNEYTVREELPAADTERDFDLPRKK
jgi:hypothetical protein